MMVGASISTKDQGLLIMTPQLESLMHQAFQLNRNESLELEAMEYGSAFRSMQPRKLNPELQ